MVAYSNACMKPWYFCKALTYTLIQEQTRATASGDQHHKSSALQTPGSRASTESDKAPPKKKVPMLPPKSSAGHQQPVATSQMVANSSSGSTPGQTVDNNAPSAGPLQEPTDSSVNQTNAGTDPIPTQSASSGVVTDAVLEQKTAKAAENIGDSNNNQRIDNSGFRIIGMFASQ